MNLVRNESNIDRIIRVVIGIVAIVAGAAIGGVGLAVGVVVGLIMLVTATVGFCPIYSALGLSTAPKDAIE